MINRSFQARLLSEKEALKKETDIQCAEASKTYIMPRCQTAHSAPSITITARKQTKCVSAFNHRSLFREDTQVYSENIDSGSYFAAV